MSPYNSVAERMEYIQRLFLGSGALVRGCEQWKDLIPLLEKEPAEYRSIAYEGASFELAARELVTTGELHQWKQFRNASCEHPFHLDIGLGWAFAKGATSPNDYLDSMDNVARSMVMDGIGYYYALFKGRSTLKNKTIPTIVEQGGQDGFDQGIGRRLFYMTRGNVADVVDLVHQFPANRHADLVRGIGIACGYVGGNNEEELLYLRSSLEEHRDQLQYGIALAAISRILSDSGAPGTELALQITCGEDSKQLAASIKDATGNFVYLYKSDDTNYNWLSRLQSKLLQTPG